MVTALPLLSATQIAAGKDCEYALWISWLLNVWTVTPFFFQSGC